MTVPDRSQLEGRLALARALGDTEAEAALEQALELVDPVEKEKA